MCTLRVNDATRETINCEVSSSCRFCAAAPRPLPILVTQDPRLRIESTPSFSAICAGPRGCGGDRQKSADGRKGPTALASACRPATVGRNTCGGGHGRLQYLGVRGEAGGGDRTEWWRDRRGVRRCDVPDTRALVVEGLTRRQGAWRVTTTDSGSLVGIRYNVVGSCGCVCRMIFVGGIVSSAIRLAGVVGVSFSCSARLWAFCWPATIARIDTLCFVYTSLLSAVATVHVVAK